MQQRTDLTKTIELPVPESSTDGNPYQQMLLSLFDEKYALLKKYNDKEEIVLLTMSLEARLLDLQNSALRLAQSDFEVVHSRLRRLQTQIRFFAYLTVYDKECIVASICKQFNLDYNAFEFFADQQPLQLHSFIDTYKEKYATIALPLHTEGAIKAAPTVHKLLVESLLYKYQTNPSFIVPDTAEITEREAALKSVVAAGSSSYLTSSSSR